MDKLAVEQAINSGQNLALVGGKVMLLVGLNNRPGNCVEVANLDSGKQYICSPEKVKVIGSVKADELPWKAGKPEGEDTPVNLGLPWPFRTASGAVVNPGEKVSLATGETAVYLGQNPRAPRFPLNIRLISGPKNGRVVRCTVNHIKGLAA